MVLQISLDLCKKPFFEAVKHLPSHVTEVVVLSPRGIYLVKRPISDDAYGDYWHVPGGYMFGGQRPEGAASDQIGKEINIGKLPEETVAGPPIDECKLLGIFADPLSDPRGPMTHFVYFHKSDTLPCGEDRGYFLSLPDKTIPHHIEYLQKLGIVDLNGNIKLGIDNPNAGRSASLAMWHRSKKK